MKIGIIGNSSKEKFREVLDELLHSLIKRKATVIADEGLREEFILSSQKIDTIFVPMDDVAKHCELLFALGGDGTILTAARVVGNTNVPIIGINLGKLGFLASISINELHEVLEELFSNAYVLDERSILQAVNSKDNSVMYGLNDIVIDKGNSFRIIEIDVFIGHDYLATYAADGIIIATQTGSTAYSLASGGPILTPSSDALVITPISPHNLTVRSVVVPLKSEVILRSNKSALPIHITSDGQNDSFYSAPLEVKISIAPYTINLVKRKNYSYFETLREKFLWGKRIVNSKNSL